MARTKMVTRTIKGTHVNVMCLDVEAGEPMNMDIDFPCEFKDDAKLLKACKERIDTDRLKAVHVVSTEVFETLYGMPETQFLENAVILPPRTSATDAETEE